MGRSKKNKKGIISRIDNRMNKIKIKNLIFFYFIFSSFLIVGLTAAIFIMYFIFMAVGDQLFNFFEELAELISGLLYVG